MKKEYRIKNTREFDEILRNRKSVGSESFVIYTREKKETLARVGISVPKKLGNAVFRNKTKRQLRSMLRPLRLHESNVDYIIIVRKNYLERSFQENQKDLEKLLKQVKI